MIRINSIELSNFKNVEQGRLVLSHERQGNASWKSSIVGIYGQNGSGKTSVVYAFGILHALFCGDPLPDFAEDCISKNSDSLTIRVEGIADWRSEEDADESMLALFTYQAVVKRNGNQAIVAKESLACRNLLQNHSSSRKLFDYSSEEDGFEIAPNGAWNALLSTYRKAFTDLAVAQQLSLERRTSFLFGDRLLDCLNRMEDSIVEKEDEGGGLPKTLQSAFDNVLSPLSVLIRVISLFGMLNLEVIPPAQQAGAMVNVLNISSHEGKYGNYAGFNIEVDLDEPALLTASQATCLRATISTISTVLEALVPGLSLNVASLGNSIVEDGTIGERVEITATRGTTTVPLRGESEGIKKLVTILILLTDVYSKPGACVVIDELDSGVFEFLLGEILQVLKEHGKGQLIFTAHNLRPLETIGKDSLYFTTTNPRNRYITFKGNKTTNNLRSQYLRAINLGGQPETIYEPTSTFEIDSAFWDAAYPSEVG